MMYARNAWYVGLELRPRSGQAVRGIDPGRSDRGVPFAQRPACRARGSLRPSARTAFAGALRGRALALHVPWTVVRARRERQRDTGTGFDPRAGPRPIVPGGRASRLDLVVDG